MGCHLSKSALRGLSACFLSLATEVSGSTQALQSQYQKWGRFFFKGRDLQCVFLHLKESLSLSKVQNTLQLPGDAAWWCGCKGLAAPSLPRGVLPARCPLPWLRSSGVVTLTSRARNWPGPQCLKPAAPKQTPRLAHLKLCPAEMDLFFSL